MDNINNGILGALARLGEDSAVLRRIIRPKRKFLHRDENSGQFSVTTFKLTGHGTFKLDGTRTLSQKEAQAIIDKANKKGKLLKTDKSGQVTAGRRQLSARETEMLNAAKQISANSDNNGILGILLKSGKKIKVLRPIGDGKRVLETTFNIKDNGALELEGSRTISRAEAEEMIKKARKEGRLIERNSFGKFSVGSQELSAKETELINSAIKQTNEIYSSLKEGKLPKKNQEAQHLGGQKLSANTPEVNKTAATPKSNNAISNSIKRLGAAMSGLNIKKSMQHPKNIPSTKQVK